MLSMVNDTVCEGEKSVAKLSPQLRKVQSEYTYINRLVFYFT